MAPRRTASAALAASRASVVRGLPCFTIEHWWVMCQLRALYEEGRGVLIMARDCIGCMG